MSDRPVLVVLRALGLGDLLAGVPALRALADAYPDHERVLATPAWLEPLVARTGAVDRIVDHRDLSPLPDALVRPAVAVDLHGRGPLSQPVLTALQPGRLIAFAHADLPATAGGPRWYADEHEVARWCRLLTESGIPADPTRLDLDPARPDVAPVGSAGVGIPGSALRPTVVHPGAASVSRRWPAERWAAVAAAEVAGGHPVVVTGGADEVDLARRVADAAGLAPDAVLAGRTDLEALIAVVAGAGRVVSGDTGTAHLATALRVPSVVVCGPVPPAEWGPPTDRPWHRALWAGRRGDPHGSTVDPGLLEIGVADVLAALAALPDRADVPSTGAVSAGAR